jgi:hypothetical protein
MQSVVVLKIQSPIEGAEMASLWAVVIRGISKPFVVDLTSSKELASGEELSELIATWLKPFPADIRKKIRRVSMYCFILF